MSARLDVALSFARRGLAVFPLHNPVQRGDRRVCSCGDDPCRQKPAKHPRIKDWERQASTAEQTIRQWWAQWPEANIGLPAGRNDLVILDIDPDHGGDESLADCERDLGPLPQAPIVITGTLGNHLFFRQPAQGRIRNSAGKLAPGIDVRGDGGYVVAAGSQHASGRTYEWDAEFDLDTTPIVELPAAWQDRMRERQTQATAANSAEPIPKGGRNAALASLAGSLRLRGLSPDALYAALAVENQARCQPPLADDEVRQIAISIGRYPAGTNGSSTESPPAQKNGRMPASEPPDTGKPEYRPTEPPSIYSQLRKEQTEPPRYLLRVGDFDVLLPDFRALFDHKKIRLCCGEQHNWIPDPLKPAAWERQLRALLEAIEEVGIPEEATDSGLLWVHILDYLKQADNENPRHAPDTVPTLADGWIYFRGEQLMRSLRHVQELHLKAADVWIAVRKHGGINEDRRFGKAHVRVWGIPASVLPDEPDDDDA